MLGDDHHVVAEQLSGLHLLGEEARLAGLARVTGWAPLQHQDSLLALLEIERIRVRDAAVAVVRAAVAAEDRRAVHAALDRRNRDRPAELAGVVDAAIVGGDARP